MDGIKINVSAIVEASAPKVWEYYTTPAHITKWNFASDDWHCPEASNDLTVGGEYRAKMAAKDGSVAFEFVATYDEITPNEFFRYTMEDGREVTVRLMPMDEKTTVSITFQAENQNPIEMQQQGWQAILDNFVKYVEQGS